MIEPIANAVQRMDALELLGAIDDRTAAAVFFDGQYRQGLDKLKFGNEGARQKARADLTQMTDAQMCAIVTESVRVLRSSGHLFLWLDKYALFEGSWRRWLPEVMPARLVDGIVWGKFNPWSETQPIGMGKRARRCFEAVAVIQKGPCRTDVWTDKGLRDLFFESADRERHAHAKPVELTKRLILATTARGDLVVDPAAGAYGVLEACLATGRQFMGCDLV